MGLLVEVGDINVKNVVVVMVIVELVFFVKVGQEIDVIVVMVGQVKLLQGGMLFMILLMGVDGEIYVIVQGNLIVGGMGVFGVDGLLLIINIFIVGCVFGGVMVECMVDSLFQDSDYLMLNLYCGDFLIVVVVVEVINEVFGFEVVLVFDGMLICVCVLYDFDQCVLFMGLLENIEVMLDMFFVCVVINLCIGIVVIGGEVLVLLVVVMYGGLMVQINEDMQVN